MESLFINYSLVRIKAILNYFFLLSGFFFLLTMLFPSNLKAQGNLLITPKRIVFEGSKRSEELNLANIGTDTATYIISFVQIKMKEDGSFEQILEVDSSQKIASNNLRFFPRSVRLGPNDAQSVKVQLLKTNELSTGEYRSHLYFRATLSDKPLGTDEKKKDSVVSVQLTPIFGITLPVLIRVGESTTKLSLSNPSIMLGKDGEPVLKIIINRSGNMSSYGDITVTYISAEGKITRVGVVKGLAVYTPNSKRDFQLKLESNQNIDYKSGKLHIAYTDQSLKPKILAEEDMILN